MGNLQLNLEPILENAGQQHLLSFFETLTSDQQSTLLEQIRQIDLPQISALYSDESTHDDWSELAQRAQPPAAIELGRDHARFSRSEAIECAPIVGVHAIADEGVLVFHDHLRFVAYGQNGLAWKSARVSWDGIRNVRIDGRRIRAEVWNAPTDAFIETELELFS